MHWAWHSYINSNIIICKDCIIIYALQMHHLAIFLLHRCTGCTIPNTAPHIATHAQFALYWPVSSEKYKVNTQCKEGKGVQCRIHLLIQLTELNWELQWIANLILCKLGMYSCSAVHPFHAEILALTCHQLSNISSLSNISNIITIHFNIINQYQYQ